ncbi:MAG: epoxyqueuosine reductase [Methanomassiliicoccaceae archaeon]|jgi:epoxyqueuosine reductase QueG|nr:epoxyqueuosine reductase [Methanomassiliicoccaceae archaeon]
MEKSALTEHIKKTARSLGIVDIGAADAELWSTDPIVGKIIPECERPSSLMKGARSVIVIGIPADRAILATAPSSYYSEHYKTINTMLDQAAQRIAMELHICGHPAIFVSRDGYQGIEGLRRDPSSFFSHRHSAYLAGMGAFGVSGMLLTENNGPRMRYTSIITTAELDHGAPPKEQLCTRCMRCTKECPEGAVTSGTYPDEITDKKRCVEYSAVLRAKGCSPCGRCLFVCPVGKDIDDNLPSDDAIANIRRYTK